MNRSHKIRLRPTAKQEVLLRKTAGTTRYAYNWAKAEWDKQYQEYKNLRDAGEKAEKPSAYTLSKRWTKERPEWSKEVARGPQTQAILNLGKAYINFWNGTAKPPTFHKRGRRDSFMVDNSKSTTKDKRVRLPNIGWVKMREELRFAGKILSYTVSHKAGQWHVAIQVDTPDAQRKTNKSRAGVDVGIAKIATASDGSVCENPRGLKRNAKRLRREQRKLARQVKGSKRRERTKSAIAKIHLKIANVRNDAIHKFTTELAKNHGEAVIETLDVQGMSDKGHRWLNRALQDTAMREVHRQLEYKMGRLTKAPKYFPSSKRCSACGDVKESLPCSIRVYKCHCGLVLDRDLNASINLRDLPRVTGFERVEPPKGAMKREAINS